MEKKGNWFGKLVRVDKEMQRKDRWERTSRWYKGVKGEGIPEYLRKKWESRWKRIMRFRLENEMRESRYWEEETKKCRLCKGSKETLRNV